MSKLPTVVKDFGVNIILVVGALFVFKTVVLSTPLKNGGLGKLANFV